MSIFLWTEDRVAELRKLWAEGVGTLEIGNTLGCGKNAAVGKAHRLNLVRRRAITPAHRLAANVTARRKALAEASLVAIGVALLDLTPSMCRWPVDESRPHLFCGQEKEACGSYCKLHAKLAYVTPAIKRVRPPREYRYSTEADWSLRFDRAA